MKQVKFLMVALTILMGMTITSCMDGETDPTVRLDNGIMKVVGTYPYAFKFSGSDIKYVATNSDALLTADFSDGDFVMISWTYNGDEQPVDQNTKEINVLVNSKEVQNITATSYVMEDNGLSFENSTVNSIGARLIYGSSEITPFVYFDKNTVIVPIIFLLKEQKLESLAKHNFTLVYNQSEVNENSGELKFYLRHRSSEEKSAIGYGFYQAFDIREALAAYGKTPSKITIMVNETNKETSNSLEDAKKELTSYSVEYKFKD